MKRTNRTERGTTPRYMERTVPVGMTPIPRYGTWDEHRDAMRHDAEVARTAAAERMGVPVVAATQWPRRNLETVMGIYESFAEGDIDAIAATWAPDIALTEPTGRVGGGTFHGRDEIVEKVFVAMANDWEGATVVPDGFVDGGDTVVARYTFSATATGSGTPVGYQGIHVFEFEDGQITQWTSYEDTALFNAALGETETGVEQLVSDATAETTTYSAADAIARLDSANAVFVDVREGAEITEHGQITGAIHAPRGMLEFHVDPESPFFMEEFGGDGEFVFYCAVGGRSALAAQTAQAMGLADVASVDGGFTAWVEADGPIDEPRPTMA